MSACPPDAPQCGIYSLSLASVWHRCGEGTVPRRNDDFAHLARSLLLRDKSLMAMFTAYFDESGTHAESRAVCIGGFVSSVSAWERLATEWNRMLKTNGVQILHRADLENFRKEFVGWDEDRRRALLRTAHRLIRKHTQKAVFGAVIKSDFDQVMPGVIKRTFGGAYGWLVQECMIGIGYWGKDRGSTDPIDYVFEAGADGRHEVDKMFGHLYRDPLWRKRLLIGSWSFAGKESVVQLQTADLLAYEVYKHMLNRIVGGPLRDIRKSMRDLIRKTDEGHYWDAARMLKWVANGRDAIRKLELREQILKAQKQ